MSAIFQVMAYNITIFHTFQTYATLIHAHTILEISPPTVYNVV